MKIEILNQHTGAVIFSHDIEPNSIAITLVEAVKRDASLQGANLRDADLICANLRDADLSGAYLNNADLNNANLIGANLSRTNLSGTNLLGANLSFAILRGADLSGTNLICGNLRDADLSGSDLSGANLRSANLRGANLRGADLSRTNLNDANLTAVRDDVWAVLLSAPREVPALIVAIKEGRVNGSSYSGACSCLVGTLANARGESYNKLIGLLPNPLRPAERFFLAIKEGDTPETSQFSALALKWAQEWLDAMTAAFLTVQVEK
jgi:uncharacterized protein YjbI with pentapeptide repeats